MDTNKKILLRIGDLKFLPKTLKTSSGYINKKQTAIKTMAAFCLNDKRTLPLSNALTDRVIPQLGQYNPVIL